MTEAKTTTPKCHNSGNLNCVSCVARTYLTKITAVHVQLPQLTAAERQQGRERSSTIMLRLGLHEVELATHALRVMTTGRWDLCAEHTVHADPLAAAKALDDATAAGGKPTNLASTMLTENPAVMRHTLQRFARLWTELRAASQVVAVMPHGAEGVGMAEELDELARGVLS